MQHFDPNPVPESGRLSRIIGSSIIPNNLFNRLVESPGPKRKLPQEYWTLFDSQHLKNDAWEGKCDQLGRRILEDFADVLNFPVAPKLDECASIPIAMLPLLPELRSELGKFGIDIYNESRYLEKIVIRDLLRQGMPWAWIFELSAAVGDWLPQRGGAFVNILEDSDRPILARFADGFVNELAFLDGDRISSEMLDSFQGVHRWGLPEDTLEKMGAIAGVTRERARQISVRLLATARDRRWWIPDQVIEVLESLVAAENLMLDSAEMRHWSKKGLKSFFATLGWPEISEKLDSLAEVWKPTAGQIRSLQNLRTGMGFVNLEELRNALGVDSKPDLAVKVLLHKYPRSVVEGNWALALTESDESQCEGAIRQQLWMNNGLTIGELYEGLTRIQTFRSQPPLPPRGVVAKLIEKAEFVTSTEGLYYGEGRPPMAGLKRDIYTFVKNAPGQIVHSAVLAEAMRQFGAKSSTMNLYFSYEPGLRKLHGEGLVHGVGAKPSPDDVRLAKLGRDAINVKSSFRYEVLPEGVVEALVRPGTNGMNSGVISVPVAFADLIGGGPLSIACCNEARFGGQLSFSGRTAWYGFSTLFEHLRDAHAARTNSEITFRVRNHALQVIEVDGNPT